jgi:hypothetical protein
MRRGGSYAVFAAILGLVVGFATGAVAQQPASEGHPSKWQANDKSMYDLVADGFKLVTVVYDSSHSARETDPDVHYFLQKGNVLARCDFRKRGETSFYWCYQLAKVGP